MEMFIKIMKKIKKFEENWEYRNVNENRIFKFPRKYKIGDRVIVSDYGEFNYNIKFKSGIIVDNHPLLKLMSTRTKEFKEWIEHNRQDYPQYQIRLDEPYKGKHYHHIILPERCINCLEKDKDEFLKKVGDYKLKMQEYDPYQEENWEND
jgi:hypothetical protein